jgi:hydroxylaminobenzene mutase
MYKNDSRRLLWHGVLLFLLGLMAGFVIQLMVNRRMGLSDHLVGVMGGMFLAILGLIWSHLRMSKGLLRITFWLALYGSYANWFTTLLAAAWGTHTNAPVTGEQFHAQPWQELIAAFGFNSLAAAMVLLCLLLLYGLRGTAAVDVAAPEAVIAYSDKDTKTSPQTLSGS